MPQEGFKRKLTAILSADVIGYSRLMRNDEEATVRNLAAHRVLITEIIQQHNGRVVDSPGDNILAEFASVVDAVNGAINIQDEIKKSNAGTAEDRRMEFRIGINLGDVIEEEGRIYGDGVNIAARVEGLAAGGGIAISGTVYEHIKDKLSLGYHYLGEQDVKNIPEPVRVYRLLTEPEDTGRMIEEEKTKSRKWLWAASAVMALILVVVGAFAIWHYYYRPSFEPASVEKMAYPLPDKPSIAVLPFDNLSGDSEQGFLSDGIADSIITALSQDPDLFVIARNSTFSYKGKPVKIQKVAEDLGVQYVLEGSVQKSGDRIRIAVQLVDAISGRNLWADQYDKNLEDLFALQDEIIVKILTALRVKLTSHGEQARQVAMGTNNPKAFLKFLKAREYQLRWNKDDNVLARQMFEEVIALDPDFAFAYSTLAWTYLMDLYFNPTKSPRESIGKASELVHKALALDDTLPFAIETLGYIYMLKREHKKAIAEYERAIALNPNLPDTHVHMGIALTYVDRLAESLTSFEKALRLNPIPPGWYLRNLARSYRMIGRYEDSISAYKGALQRSRDDLFSQAGLTATYSAAGRLNEARAQAAEVLRAQPKFSVKDYTKTFPFKNKAETDKLTAALLKAGLPEHPPLKLPDKPSIAVLPFNNISGDPEQEYFSDGLTEEIITALSKVPKMIVIARNSTFTYKGKPTKVQQVAEDLGVRYVLEGSVRKDKNKVRITAQLIDALSGHHLWADRYDRDLKDIFAVQDEITMTILNALEVKLTDGEQALLHKKGTNNLQVYLKLLQGIHYARNVNPENNLKARRIFEEIIDQEPNYASAYTLLARTYWLEAFLGTSKSKKESLQKGTNLSEKSISIDNSQGASYAVLGQICILRRDWDKGIAMLYKAIELEPNGAESNYYLGLGLNFAGRPEEAIPPLKKAIRLNPIAPAGYLNAMAIAYRMVGQYDKAIEYLEKGIQQYPNHTFLHVNLSACYILAGRDKEAHAEAKEILRLSPKFSVDKFDKALQLRNQEEKKRFIGALRKAFAGQGDQ